MSFLGPGCAFLRFVRCICSLTPLEGMAYHHCENCQLSWYQTVWHVGYRSDFYEVGSYLGSLWQLSELQPVLASPPEEVFWLLGILSSKITKALVEFQLVTLGSAQGNRSSQFLELCAPPFSFLFLSFLLTRTLLHIVIPLIQNCLGLPDSHFRDSPQADCSSL